MKKIIGLLLAMMLLVLAASAAMAESQGTDMYVYTKNGKVLKVRSSMSTKDDSNVYSGTAYIPFGATLAAGNQHDVKINIGKNSLYSSANTKIIN